MRVAGAEGGAASDPRVVSMLGCEVWTQVRTPAMALSSGEWTCLAGRGDEQDASLRTLTLACGSKVATVDDVRRDGSSLIDSSTPKCWCARTRLRVRATRRFSFVDADLASCGDVNMFKTE